MRIERQLGKVGRDDVVECCRPGTVVAMIQADGEVSLEEAEEGLATLDRCAERGCVVHSDAAETKILDDVVQSVWPARDTLFEGPAASNDGGSILGFVHGMLDGIDHATGIVGGKVAPYESQAVLGEQMN